MSESRNTARPGPADVHVRISRLIVDRAAVGDAGVHGLRESIARRIADRLEHPAGPPEGGPYELEHPAGPPKGGLYENAIATAVVQQVSSRLNLGRRR